MIYGRFGDEVTIVRRGTLDDVRQLDKRKPDQADRDNVERGGYVVIRQDNGKEILAHVSYLRADNGWAEISDAIDALEGAQR
jgi:hypothetical protein